MTTPTLADVQAAIANFDAAAAKWDFVAELAQAVELLARATPGEWLAINRGGYGEGDEGTVETSESDIDGASLVQPPGDADTMRGDVLYADAAAIAAAVNFLRTHGPAMLAMERDGGIVGECIELGDDETGQPRILIHTTREAIKAHKEAILFRPVTVSLSAIGKVGS